MAIYIPDVIIRRPHQLTGIVVHLEMIGGSSEFGVEALSKLDISELLKNTLVPFVDKTYADFMEAMILRHSQKKIPKGLTPTGQREVIDSILNDPKVRHRFVFRQWPSSINPDFSLKTLPGKMAPNGVKLWGSTLFDFFCVQPIPFLNTFSTGSQLLGWCKANGKYEGHSESSEARQCIAWTEEEKDPEVVPVYNIANLIRSLENVAFAGDEEKHHGSEEDIDDEKPCTHSKDIDPLPRPWPPKSVFDSSAYLGPWADAVPFSASGPWCFKTLPVLEEYIPQSRLPKKIIVHDPWDLLSADGHSPTNVTWNERVQENPSCVYTYELRLSDKPEHTKRRQGDEEDQIQREITYKRILDNFLANPHSSTTRPDGLEIRNHSRLINLNVPIKPVIFVVLPPRPPLAAAGEGHLYLSPHKSIGRGNHSYVYKAEWELPRSCLVGEQICIECAMDDFEAILREEDGENGETRDRRWDELSGKMVFKEVVIPPYEVTIEGDTTEEIDYVLREGKRSREVVYEGPYRVIHSRVKYQNLARAPYCKHLQSSIHPLTTKVQVTAKLSIQYDHHLHREAENYQHFPRHFFEYWSGYNLLPPLHDPTPVGPLVPQFYGYYVPKKEDNERHTATKRYLSPILLLEHCGKPIERLSIDDKHECISLALRLHETMWVHGSFHLRNILRKAGPLSAHPKDREANRKKRGKYGVDWSFRLIDFGRSQYVGNEPEGIIEPLDHEHQVVRCWHEEFRELD